MVKIITIVAAAATTLFVSEVSAINDWGDTTSSISATVRPAETSTSDNAAGLTTETACVIADFQTATPDFIALNNLLDLVKMTPSLLSPYVSDPLILEDVTLAALNYSYLGYDLQVTPTFNWMNVSGITTIAPYAVNVTSSNTLDIGAEFTGTVALEGSMTFEVSQPERAWHQICVVDPLHPLACKPQIVTVHLSVSVDKPSILANVRANVFECAPSVPVSACQNLTVNSIMVDALGGNMSAVYASVYKNLNDVKINSLKLGWDVITQNDIFYVVHDTSEFVSRFMTHLLSTDIDKLNKKRGYYRRYVRVVRTILRSLMDKSVDSSLEPRFGATCL